MVLHRPSGFRSPTRASLATRSRHHRLGFPATSPVTSPTSSSRWGSWPQEPDGPSAPCTMVSASYQQIDQISLQWDLLVSHGPICGGREVRRKRLKRPKITRTAAFCSSSCQPTWKHGNPTLVSSKKQSASTGGTSRLAHRLMRSFTPDCSRPLKRSRP